MFRKPTPPDPLEQRRRELEAQERELAGQMARLAESLGPDAPAALGKAAEPPVWRMEEEEAPPLPPPETAPARRRHLGRQRKRDRIVFLICFAALLVAVLIVFWLFRHYSDTAT